MLPMAECQTMTLMDGFAHRLNEPTNASCWKASVAGRDNAAEKHRFSQLAAECEKSGASCIYAM
jgi:hypothetical protein